MRLIDINCPNCGCKIHVEPERKKGKWIDDCSCSVCHWIHENDDCCVLLTDYKYCPNCGAKMEGNT